MKKTIIGLFTIGFILVYGATTPTITSMPKDGKYRSNGKDVTIVGVIRTAQLDSAINFKDDSGGVSFLTNSKMGNKISSVCKSEDYCEITGIVKDDEYGGWFTSISKVRNIQDNITMEVDEQSISSNDEELKLCIIDGIHKEIYTTDLTVSKMANYNDNNIKTNGDKIIITIYDVRGTELADIIGLQANFTNRPSCYMLWGIYFYREDRFLRNQDYFFEVLYSMFGLKNVNAQEEPLDLKDILN